MSNLLFAGNRPYIPSFTLGLLALLAPLGANAAIPILTFDPQTPTTISVPVNGIARVDYLVTNRSNLSRTWAMNPIQGIDQIATGSNPCSPTFFLAGQQSCVLQLNVTGAQIPSGGVHGGPIVCNVSSQLQCYQPSQINSLNIGVGPPLLVEIAVNPGALTFTPGSTGVMTVTHTGNIATNAQDISADVPAGIDIVVDADACTSLAPFASCDIQLSASLPQQTSTLIIGGINTNMVDVAVTVTNDPLFADGFE